MTMPAERPPVGSLVYLPHLDEVATVVPSSRLLPADEVAVMRHNPRPPYRPGGGATIGLRAVRVVRTAEQLAQLAREDPRP